MNNEDDLGIRDLVRTYTFLNDPRIKQVTTKFLAVTLTMGALFALYAYNIDNAPAPATASQAAPTGEAWPQETCMPLATYRAWAAENPQYEVADVEVQEDGVTVCFTFAPTSFAA